MGMSTFPGKSIDILRAVPAQNRRDQKGIFERLSSLVRTEAESNALKI